jgi:hypothetical protein
VITSWERSLPDEGVDLSSLDVVQGLNGLLYLSLVRGDIDDENKGVVLLNLLKGGLGGQGVLDNIVSLGRLSRLAGLRGELRVSGELEGLGAIEVHLGVNRGGLAAAALLQSSGGLLGCRKRRRSGD